MVMESDSKTQQAGHPDSRKNSEPRGSKPFLEKLGIQICANNMVDTLAKPGS